MNIFVKFGNWLESRKIIRKPDLEIFEVAINSNFERQHDHICVVKKALRELELASCSNESVLAFKQQVDEAIMECNRAITALDLAVANAVPQTITKELALINVRLNRVELFVGLKRDPQPEHVPGTAKIS